MCKEAVSVQIYKHRASNIYVILSLPKKWQRAFGPHNKAARSMPTREMITKLFNRRHGKQSLPLLHKSSSSRPNDPSSEHAERGANESEALQSNTPTVSIVPISCWDRALEKLRKEHGKRYKELKDASDKTWSGVVEPMMLIASAQRKVKELDINDWRAHRVSRQVLRAMTSMEKVVRTVAVLDPQRGASIACAGVFTIVQVALGDIRQYEFALTCVATVSSAIERWIHFERRSLNSRDPDLLEAEDKLKDNLVEFYLEIMIHLSTMAAYCQKSSLGMGHDPPSPLSD